MTDVPNASLYVVDPDTGALTALPHFTRLAVAEIRNGIGKVEVDYPVYGLNFDRLAATTVEDRDVEVEVWLVGRQEYAVRGILTDTAGDDLAEDSVWRFEGWTLDVLLDEALVWPQVGTDKQELVLSSNNAGVIVDYLIDQAQTRGGLVGVTTGFTGSLDSNGDAWANVVTATFSPSATLLDVLQELIEIGMIDAFRLGADRVLHMWNPDGQGIDRTLTSPPVVFRRGRDLMESPRRHTVRNSATTVLAVGSDNLYEDADDAAALARRGRRVEVVGSANSLKDAGSVTAYAQQLLATVTPGAHEVTHGLRVGAGLPIPWVDYASGDWVWSDTRNTLDRLRIQQLELEYGPAGYAGTVVLNTAVVDRVSAIARKLKRISSGTAVVGTSDLAPETDDGLAPAQVLGVSASSTAYVGNDGVTWAAVQAGWTAVTTNDDTSLAGDIAGYFPSYRYTGAGMPTDWQVLGQVSGTLADWSGVVPGKAVEVRVAAVDKWGHLGAWSSAYAFTSGADATPPPVPSTPVVDSYLGLLTVTWDGLGSVGETQPVDFDRVEVHVSTSSGFTPSSSTRVDRLRGKGTIPWDGGTYGVTYYGKLVAYDRTGNASAASAQDSVTLAQAADGDIGALSIGKLTTGIMSAIMTLSGTIRTASSGNRFEADSAGWRLYRPSGTVSLDAQSSTGDLIAYQSNGTTPTFRVQGSTGNVYLYKTDGTTAALQLTASTGLVDMVGKLTAGTVGGDRVVVDPAFTVGASTRPALVFKSDNANASGPARVTGNNDGTGAAGDYLSLASGPSASGSTYTQGALRLYSDQIQLQLDNGTTDGERGGALFLTRTQAILACPADGATSASVLCEDSFVSIGYGSGNFFEATSSGIAMGNNGVAKTFVIDHPDDPDRLLVHACAEGPTADVIYRGTAEIVDGLAVVQLPAYFEGLVEPDNRQVFLTPILTTGAGRPVVAVAAASEVKGGMFHVLCPAPDGTRVNWLVVATRKNVPFPVEPLRDEVTVGGDGPYRYLQA